MSDPVRIGRAALAGVEVLLLTVVIVSARCTNYHEVFFGAHVYFSDADCYARMTRVRMCAQHPGLIVRHHDFENFPVGTTPHTTAPLDYLIVELSILLRPFTAQPLDLAGAFISPLLALVGGWFLWWWSRQMTFRYRWPMLMFYAISPILVHGTELGRPDHQSLSILLVTIGTCAEWRLRNDPPRKWSIVSGVAWALAIWVSLYEPLLLLLLIVSVGACEDRQSLFGRDRRTGWAVFFGILVVALLVEQRVPSLAIFRREKVFLNWARSIGELRHVPPLDPIWFRWIGYLIAVAPLLIWAAVTMRKSMSMRTSQGVSAPRFVLALLVASYLLTIWQARWGYFFALLFALALPLLLEPIQSRAAVWVAFLLSILPVLREWDAQLWPNEMEYARRIERRNELAQLHQLATVIQSRDVRPFLAPWWLSPAVVYWSGQPGVAGSSHESLQGIVDSARFYSTEDWETARAILRTRRVAWVFAYDAERLAENSSAILGEPILRNGRSLCFVLDRVPVRAPAGLNLAGQNSGAKLYRVTDSQ